MLLLTIAKVLVWWITQYQLHIFDCQQIMNIQIHYLHKKRERLWRLSSATVSSHGGQLNQVNRGWASGLPCHIRETQLWYKGDPTPTSVRPNSLIGVTKLPYSHIGETSIRDSDIKELNLLPMSSRPDYYISHVLHVCHVRRKNHQDPTIRCGVICWNHIPIVNTNP